MKLPAQATLAAAHGRVRPARRARDSSGWVGRFAREHFPLVFLTAAYIVAGVAVQELTGLDIIREVGWASISMGAFMGLLFAAIAAGSLLAVYLLSRGLQRVTGGQRAITSTWADYRSHLTPYRLLSLFIPFFLLVPLMNVFVGFKGAIPEIQPFAWDPELMRLDRALHLGHDPWRLLQPLLGHPWLTHALDALYYFWFPIKMLFLIWMAWSPRRELRNQFLLTFFALWIVLGTLVATAFSSAGPCYYGLVTGLPDPFVPLMDYLREVDRTYALTALDVQAHLWAGYASGRMHLIEGIAAMPSLHVALPVLYAICGWKVDRRLGIAFGIYALVILIGSVHLGWHYAVDGYVTLLLVPFVWWGAGHAQRAWEGRATRT
ncbi:MAG: phosphatase PAP2 family protein [Gemmatimonadetes bacterium]|nr:phosphatase PAP2 family protein [Gemmatimonadota bacterium]